MNAAVDLADTALLTVHSNFGRNLYKLCSVTRKGKLPTCFIVFVNQNNLLLFQRTQIKLKKDTLILPTEAQLH